MATHVSVLTCKIPWIEEPGGLQYIESQSQTQLSTHTCLVLAISLGTCDLVLVSWMLPIACKQCKLVVD